MRKKLFEYVWHVSQFWMQFVWGWGCAVMSVMKDKSLNLRVSDLLSISWQLANLFQIIGKDRPDLPFLLFLTDPQKL